MDSQYICLDSARPEVQDRKVFITPNTSGVWYKKLHKKMSDLYIVRAQTPESYEITLFIYDPDAGWFENTTEYGTAVHRYKKKLHPLSSTIPMDEIAIISLIMAGGYKQLIKRRING